MITDKLKNWRRFQFEMQRVKRLFPEFAADIETNLRQAAEKIRQAADIETGATLDDINLRAESMRLCALCGFPLAVKQKNFCSVICGAIAKRKNYTRGKYIHLNVRGKRVFLHRVVWEKNNGRRLSAGEDVHHINGNARDNRPENLQALTRSAHTALHNRQRRELNGNLFEGL